MEENENENEYGDFEEIKDETKKEAQAPSQENSQFPARARLPRGNQIVGIVIQRLGGNRMSVKTTDNKTRNCRVPGRFKRKFWLREGNFVMIEPWADDDEKGDIVYQYRPNEISQLKKKINTENLNNNF